MTTYTYALAEAGEDYLLQRKRDDSEEWLIVCMIPDREIALDIVRDLNTAQRMRPRPVPVLETGQELRKPVISKT